MTSTYKINVRNASLEISSRLGGECARRHLLSKLMEFDNLEIDFDFESLTPSFADERLGRLAAEIGLDAFKRRVKLLHLEESSKPLVKHVYYDAAARLHFNYITLVSPPTRFGGFCFSSTNS
jgi:hypothetical protein